MRIRLDVTDLGRLRFSTAVNAFSETMISFQTLRASGAHHRSVAAGLLHDLVPPRGPIPDFLTPAAAGSIEDAAEAVRSTPPAVIIRDVAAAYRGLPVTPSRRALAGADPAILGDLVDATTTMFRQTLEPSWPMLTAGVGSHVGERIRHLAAAGLDGVLNSLHPAIRWQAPVLTVDTGTPGPGTAREVVLAGRGLTLGPWPLAGPLPRVLLADDQPAFVMYPIAVASTSAQAAGALNTLIGRTRAAALRHLAVRGQHSTRELAQRLGVSAASASEHAAALRNAGLVSTVRAGRSVRHSITTLGVTLVRSATP